MGQINKIYYLILSLLCDVLVSSCADDVKRITDGDSYSIIKGDKVEVHLKVNLDKYGSDRMRTRDMIGDNDGIHNPDYDHPGIGGGTLATTLIYQLYDQDGNPVALPNPDSSSDIIGLHQVRVENRQFPYSDIVFTVDNGKEYTMIFWAQSGEVGNDYGTKGDWFYETEDLKNIIVRYDTQNEETGEGQLNNTDSRDAFCAKVKFTGGKPLPEVTLRRVLAQVNIGFTGDLWEKLQASNVDIQKSSVWIANVGRRFNLLKNQVELFSSGNATENQEDIPEATGGEEDTGKGGITWPFTMGAYNINTIPAYMKYPGKSEQDENKLKIGNNNYHWISMCYILSPGETEEEWLDGISIANDHGSTVDIVNIQFYDKNNVAYNLPLTELLNVPVKRNFRTNIIVDDLFNASITMDAQIGTDTYDDFGIDSDGIYDGELTDGLTYKIREGNSANWENTTWGNNMHYKNGLEFYVSSLQGLKWLADRSNGLDFKLRDVPAWMIKNEGWENLNDKEKLYAYEKKIFDIVFGEGENPNFRRTMLSDFTKNFAYRNKYGYRMPWTYDDCIIYLTNDLDFNEASEELRQEWHGFNSNMSYQGGGGEWYVKDFEASNPKEIYTNSQTNDYHGFKGIFDGQGYTIYNMVIDNLHDFYEYSEMDGQTYGPRKLHNAAFICTAKEKVSIKNLRLYNAEIRGDYNIGGFIGYMGGNYTLEMENCRFVNGLICGEEADRLSPSDDANVGGIGGSLQCNLSISNCEVVNSDIISSFIGGAFIGITSGSANRTKTYKDCKVYNTNVILSEINNIGANMGWVYRKGWSIGSTNQSSFFFGTTNDNYILNNDTGDSSINAFYGIKYSPTNNTPGDSQSANPGAFGKSEITNLPLELFPDILTEYAQSLTLKSHITGYAREKGGMAYGLKIDISRQPKTYTGKLISNDKEGNINKNDNQDADAVWYFTFSGSEYYSSPLDGPLSGPEEKYKRQNVLLISPNGKNAVKGVYVCAPDLPQNAERHVLIEKMIIAGEPSIEYGLYLDNVKDLTLDHVAIYDVKNAFGDGIVPNGASFKTIECDFRGITNVGKGYSTVNFKNTAFNKGSGLTENVIGRLYANSSATFEGCMFRVDYKIVVEKENAVLTFKDCMCGPPYNQVALTKENFWKYMDSSDEHAFIGKIKFNGDSQEYTYADLLKFKPQ